MEKREEWEINRRKFIKSLTAIGIATQFGFLEACSNLDNKIKNPFFSTRQLDELSATINVLFPDNGNGPSAEKINVIPHILWTLQDKTYGFDAYDMFKISLKELDSYCRKEFDNPFSEKSEAIQIDIINLISKLKWGDRFLSNTLNYIFEALVIDPLYNVNNNQAGWKWLNHNAGFPRPENKDLYPNFLERLSNEV